MPDRLEVSKTYKLFIGGAFPRSESGRSLAFEGKSGIAHISHASRKDLRDAVEAARKAQPGWTNATAYNRGQVLYRMAEMLEGKRDEFVSLIEEGSKASSHRGSPAKNGKGTKSTGQRPMPPSTEVEVAIDRLVNFGGWADKYSQVLGCNNPVSGPFYNFTVPEPTGVVGVIAPDEAPLLGLISLLAPAVCAGNTVVALASEANPLPGAVLGEVCATSDVPAGVINILTGQRTELVPHFASHREIDAIHAAGVSGEHATSLREGAADNVKRVTVRDGVDWLSSDCQSPWWIESFVEMKTIWHPSGV